MNAPEPRPEEHAFSCELPSKPYPGLRPFDKSEWPIFFGRERMIDDVVERLLRDRFLVVHGDSGAGKSSLIYAGVLPRLEQDVARGGARWSTCSSNPADDPLWNLARSLSGLGGESSQRRIADIRRLLNFGRDAVLPLAKLLRRDSEHHICMLVDQFEELFADRRQTAEAALLVELLIGIREQRVPGIYAVLTMRSEFFGACARFQGFAETVNASQYLLPRMEHADLLRAICEPATLFDGFVERIFAEKLIADAARSQDSLPLIQHGLMLLHSRALQTNAALGVLGFRLGLGSDRAFAGKGLAELLSSDADEVARAALSSCGEDPEKSRVVEDMFRALTDVNAEGHAIRRPQTLKQLVAVCGAPEGVVRSIVDAFRAEGVSFLRPFGASQLALEDRIDISHEALIRCWRKVADPVDGWLNKEFKNGLVWRSLLVQADSFETNPNSLLSIDTAEERVRWLTRRNAAWSDRYGGGWDRVAKLVRASAERADRAKELQRKLDQEATVARIYRIVAAVVALLTVVSVILAVKASRATVKTEGLLQLEKRALRVERQARKDERLARQAEDRARLAEDQAREAEKRARADEEATRMSAETQRRATEDALQEASVERRAREETQAILRAVAFAPTLDSALRRRVEIGARIEPAPAAPAPRLYIYYSDATQRDAAIKLGTTLIGFKIGARPLAVPAAKLSTTAGASELRCFRSVDCVVINELLGKLADSLKSGRPRLADYSKQFESSTALRPGHYELWLSRSAF